VRQATCPNQSKPSTPTPATASSVSEEAVYFLLSTKIPVRSARKTTRRAPSDKPAPSEE
jgi:hypothetical protein